MGTLLGHLLPGLAFLSYSLYYSVLVSLALLRGRKVLKLSASPRKQRGPRPWQHLLYEGIVKVTVTSVIIVGELFYPPGVNRMALVDWEDPRRPFLFKDGWQHITMFGFFLISGVVDIVSHRCLVHQSLKLQRATEALAFFVLALLMAAHVENKSTLEIRVHFLFMLLCFLLAVVLTVEVWLPDQPSLWVLKTWLALVLSNWLLQLSVVLYVPPTGQPWGADNPTDLAFLSIFFCWHLALGVALLATIYGFCSLWWHYHHSSWTEAVGTKYHRCSSESSGEELEKLRAEAVLQDDV